MRQLLPLHSTCKPPAKGHVWTLPLICAGGVLVLASPARAQTAGTYFPTGTAGYDQNLGVTVLSRLRPEYEQPGIQLGGFTIRPTLNQSIFDNTNVNGTSGSNSGSWGEDTSGSVTGQSDWTRNSLNAALGFDHNQFFAFPNESYTNWNVGIGGGYTIGDGLLTASYSHSSYNQLGTTIGLAQSETPALDTTDTAEVGYTFNFGRMTVTPTLDVSAYRFGDVTVGGVRQSQSAFNRNDIAGGVVARYALTGAAGLLFVARGVGSNYINQAPGQLSYNSTSALVLAGLDYQAESVWRYSLLFGVEHQSFAASQYGEVTSPIVSAQVVYTPTGVTTITGSLTRSLQNTNTGASSGYVLTQANLVADYELLRNVLLEGRAGFQHASYMQGGGNQNNETVGGSVTWLFNRYMRLSVNDDFTNQTAPGTTVFFPNTQNPTFLSGAYTQNLLMITLSLGL